MTVKTLLTSNDTRSADISSAGDGRDINLDDITHISTARNAGLPELTFAAL